MSAGPAIADVGRSAAAQRLSLAGSLTIGQANAQRERILEALGAGDGDLLVDLQAVDAIDTAGVQLLLAGRRMLTDRGATLVVERGSPAVLAALATCGLSGAFGLSDSAAPASAAVATRAG